MRPSRHQMEECNVATPKEVYNYRVYILAAVASFGASIFGYDLAFIGTTLALDSFRKYMFLLILTMWTLFLNPLADLFA